MIGPQVDILVACVVVYKLTILVTAQIYLCKCYDMMPVVAFEWVSQFDLVKAQFAQVTLIEPKVLNSRGGVDPKAQD